MQALQNPVVPITDDEQHHASKAAQLLLASAIEDVATSSELQSVMYFKGNSVHRAKVRAWQALCTLTPAVVSDEAVMTVLLEHVFDALVRPELASVRQYQESVLFVLLARRPEAVRSRLLPILREYGGKGEAVASILLVTAHILLVQPLHIAAELVPELVRHSQ